MDSSNKSITLSSGQKMPIFGLGAFKTDKKEIITQAITEAGYRHIDTAKVYENEEVVGEGIQDALSQGINREDLFITSKLWRDDFSDPVSALKTSLEKLKLDYLDLYLVHWPTADFVEDGKGFAKTPIHKVWEGMEQCVEQGLVKSIGISNFNVQLICDMLTYCNIKPANNQIELHPYYQQEELVKFCQKFDISVTAYCPFASIGQEGDPLNILDDQTLIDIGKKYDKKPSHVALAWNLKRNVCVIPKTSHIERAKENLEALDLDLDEDDLEKIKKLDKDSKKVDPGKWDSWYHTPVFK